MILEETWIIIWDKFRRLQVEGNAKCFCSRIKRKANSIAFIAIGVLLSTILPLGKLSPRFQQTVIWDVVAILVDLIVIKQKWKYG